MKKNKGIERLGIVLSLLSGCIAFGALFDMFQEHQFAYYTAKNYIQLVCVFVGVILAPYAAIKLAYWVVQGFYREPKKQDSTLIPDGCYVIYDTKTFKAVRLASYCNQAFQEYVTKHPDYAWLCTLDPEQADILAKIRMSTRIPATEFKYVN